MKRKIDRTNLYRETISRAWVRNSKRTLKIIDRFMEKDPDHLDLLWYKSVFLQAKGRNEEALEVALRMAALYPDREDAFAQLADVYRSKRNYNKAILSYAKAIEILKDKQGQGIKEEWKGYYKRRLKNYRKEIKEILQLKNHPPKRKKLSLAAKKHRREERGKLYNLGYKLEDLEERGRYRQAMKYAERMVTLYHEYPRGFAEAGDLYKKMKKYEKAYEYYQKAITRWKMVKAVGWEPHYKEEFDDLIQDIREEIAEIPAGKLKAIKKKFKPGGPMPKRI